MSKTAFRILVIASLVLGIGSVVADFATARMLPEALREYRESTGENVTPGLVLTGLGGLGVLALGLISTVGLLLFWRPARILYTVTNLLAFLLLFAIGASVTTAVTEFLSITSTFLGGIIWGIIYFSPLKEEFDEAGEPAAP